MRKEIPPLMLMKDYCVIDEDAAWQLFGSNDVAGMTVYIGGVPHIVTGVIRRPASLSCAPRNPEAYARRPSWSSPCASTRCRRTQSPIPQGRAGRGCRTKKIRKKRKKRKKSEYDDFDEAEEAGAEEMPGERSAEEAGAEEMPGEPSAEVEQEEDAEQRQHHQHIRIPSGAEEMPGERSAEEAGAEEMSGEQSAEGARKKRRFGWRRGGGKKEPLPDFPCGASAACWSLRLPRPEAPIRECPGSSSGYRKLSVGEGAGGTAVGGRIYICQCHGRNGGGLCHFDTHRRCSLQDGRGRPGQSGQQGATVRVDAVAAAAYQIRIYSHVHIAKSCVSIAGRHGRRLPQGIRGGVVGGDELFCVVVLIIVYHEE